MKIWKRQGQDDPYKIIYAGKLSTAKGIFPLIEALAELDEDSKIPAFELLLAGGCQDEGIARLLSGKPALRAGDAGELKALPSEPVTSHAIPRPSSLRPSEPATYSCYLIL